MSSLSTNIKFTFAKADLRHTDALFELVNKAYQRDATGRETTARFSSKDAVKSALTDSKIHWLVLQDKEKVIGSLQIAEKNERFFLGAFAIDPEYRPHHLGTKMIECAEASLRAKKITKVFLDVISVAKAEIKSHEETWELKQSHIEAEDDALAKFYEKLGFVFNDQVEIAPLKWQRETRKDEYLGKVFFREMEKAL